MQLNYPIEPQPKEPQPKESNQRLYSADVLELTQAEQKQQILSQFNRPSVDYPSEQKIHQLFEAQVERTPEAIALSFADQTLSYAQFNQKTNQLARVLQAKNIQQGDIVAVLAERSVEMMIAIFAILKAGASYLPLSPELPTERVEFILQDTQTKLVLTQAQWMDHYPPESFTCPRLMLAQNSDTSLAETNLNLDISPQSVAYIIYTSGSTGLPKGVMIQHFALTNRLWWMQKAYPLSEQDCVLQKTPISFDVSIWELFWWSFTGARLHLLVPGGEKEPLLIEQAIAQHQVSTLHFVPSMLQIFLHHLEQKKAQAPTFAMPPCIKQLFTSGEALAAPLVTRCHQSLLVPCSAQLINLYGPTEATIDVSYFVCDDPHPTVVPIGKPIDNIRLYILSPEGTLQPPGVAGELCIAGDGVAKGYLNRPDLNQQSFLVDPFVADSPLYRTGDLARWLNDGNIEYLGRMDRQIKLRGFRIELGEIEAQLEAHPEVRQAAVMDLKDAQGDTFLCAWCLAPSTSSSTLTQALKTFLATKLPYYMVPTHFVFVADFVLTASGKLDLKKLPRPDLSQTGQLDNIANTEPNKAPQNQLQQQLVEIWQTLLGVSHIGIEAHFFDLGGHSLKAMNLQAILQQKFAVQLSLQQLFKTPTIATLAAFIAQQRADVMPVSAAEPAALNASTDVDGARQYPMSSVQKRLYVLDQMAGCERAYHITGAWWVDNAIEPGRAEAVLQQLIQRHESLRSSFHFQAGEWVCRVPSTVAFSLQQQRLDEAQLDHAIDGLTQPFDLTRGPLLQAGLFSCVSADAERTLLVIDFHHIAVDGLSWTLLMQEFMSLYRGETLTAVAAQYSDFAAEEQRYLQSERFVDDQQYWLAKFAEDLPNLDLPIDFARPREKSYRGASVRTSIDADTTAALKQLAQRNQVTPYMVLLPLFQLFLAKLSGQSQLVCGTAIAARPLSGRFDQAIGMFTNTLALSCTIPEQISLPAFLQLTKTQWSQDYDHREYPFEQLIRALKLKQTPDRNPLFETMFVYENTDQRSLDLGTGPLTEYHYDLQMAMFDLTVEVIEQNGQLNIDFQYNTELWRASTIERWQQHFVHLLQQAIANPTADIHQFELIQAAEKQQILNQFNPPAVAYPKDKPIHQLFEAQVERTPEAIAISFIGQNNATETLTYDQFNRKVNQLARVLLAQNIQQGDIVGLLSERCAEMVIGVFAILKVGASYLPLEPDLPQERFEFIVQDTEAKLILAQDKCLNQYPPESFICPWLILEASEHYQGADSNLMLDVAPETVAYIIYTSGSTGQPKGVMLQHFSLTNQLCWTQKTYPLEQGDCILQRIPISFDVSVWELLGWCFTGARLHLLEPGGEKDPLVILNTIEQHQITTLMFAPSLLQLVIQYLQQTSTSFNISSLKQIFSLGEALPPALVSRCHQLLLAKSQAILVNIYGPSEATIDTLHYQCDDPNPVIVPIGKPIDNTRLYILNRHGSLQPIGIPGELCIAGEAIGKGYVNRPELNQRCFVEDPRQPGVRFYKTGDLARWLADGNVEYLGRIDRQVKIAGIRIELGEIEAQLQAHPQVKQAVVTSHTNGQGVKALCAYCVAPDTSTEQLKQFLATQLPDYMLPQHFIFLSVFPLTVSEKIDVKNLPCPEVSESTAAADYVAPRNTLEKQLVAIWQDVLAQSPIGIHANFFDCGGHSLKAMNMQILLQQKFAVHLLLSQLFQTPTIAELATFLQQQNADLKVLSTPLADASIPLLTPPQPHYLASSAQKRLYVLQQFDKTSTHYNLPFRVYFGGDLDQTRLEWVLQQLIQRHEALRTTFFINADQLQQKIQPQLDWQLAIEDLTDSSQDLDKQLQAFIQPFELSQAPLFRARLLCLGEKNHLLLLDFHHAIADGVSVELFWRELTQLYQAHRVTDLPPLRLQFKEFAAWQTERLSSQALQQQGDWWLQGFQGEIPVLNLPYDFARPSSQSFVGDTLFFQLAPSLSQDLRQLSQTQGCTMHMLLLSAFNILLHKLSGQQDIVVGVPVSLRGHSDLNKVMGMFVNTLAIRSAPQKTKTTGDFLNEVKQASIGAFDHQDWPLENLVEGLNLSRDMSRNPLFDCLFSYQSGDGFSAQIDGLQCRVEEPDLGAAKFDLSMIIIDKQAALNVNIDYCTALFKPESIALLQQQFTHLLTLLVEPDSLNRPLGELSLLQASEKTTLLRDYNNTQVDYPSQATAHWLFEQQVIKTPDQIALVFAGQSLTYQQCNDRANQLAQHLRSAGLSPALSLDHQPQCIVAVLAEHSVEWVLAILAIFKAGGAYLPLDPRAPQARLMTLLNDSGAQIMLCHSHFQPSYQDFFNGKVFHLDQPQLWQNQQDGAAMPEQVDDPLHQSRLAYVIYTSGSTGKPKGVLLGHQGLVNLALDHVRRFNISGGDHILQFANPAFDASLMEVFMTLLSGATLHLVEQSMIDDHRQLESQIQQQAISLMILPPSYLALMEPDRLPSLRALLTVGSATNFALVKKWGDKIYYSNGYGPSENSIGSTIYTVPLAAAATLDRHYASIPIGKPFDNVQVYIVDQDLQLQPMGVPGELCVGGDGLAFGYLNRPQLTQQQFVTGEQVPWMREADIERIYRTGDLARWLPSNSGSGSSPDPTRLEQGGALLEFLGRLDQQVKIRGQRIELGEIESQLQSLAQIQQAAVIDRLDLSIQSEKYLCAYYVGADRVDRADDDLSPGELRRCLAEKLPDYMLPSYFIALDKIPLTANGKLNRQALPLPDLDHLVQTNYQAPQSELESQLADLWQTLLGVAQVGGLHHFFELGGHSLKATVLIAQIQQTFAVQLSLRDIFQCPQLAQMADLIAQCQVNNSADNSTDRLTIQPAEIPRLQTREAIAAAPGQNRLYIVQQFEPQQTHYNVPSLFHLRGQVDQVKLEQCLRQLVQRHESLRTSFVFQDQQVWQRVDTEVEWTLKLQSAGQQLNSVLRPFDLTQAPLFRMTLSSDPDAAESFLLIEMHHIIADGASIAIFMRELVALYQGQTLAPLPLQYLDFSAWMQQRLSSPAIQAQKDYWTRHLAGELPRLELPYDFPRSALQSFAGDSVDVMLPENVQRRIQQLAHKNDCTLYVVFFAVFQLLLHKYSQQNSVLVGTPAQGRSHPGLSNIMGMFVNTLVIKSPAFAGAAFLPWLSEFKETLLQAQEQQDFPFEDLVEALGAQGDRSRNPLFDVCFNYENAQLAEQPLADATIELIEPPTAIAKFDLTCTITQTSNGELQISFNYCRDLFRQDTIKRMQRHFLQLLQQVVAQPNQPLAEYSILTAAEREQIVSQFNPPASPYPDDKNLVQLFEAQVAQYPQRQALFSGGEGLSYQQLNTRANQLARHLRLSGVVEHSIVAIWLNRSVDYVVAVLAVLKAGAAWLPLDQRAPVDRVQSIVSDSEAVCLLSSTDIIAATSLTTKTLTTKTLLLDTLALSQQAGHNLELEIEPHYLAYLIYTSGSTGRPKGVMIEHTSLVNFISDLPNWYQNTDSDTAERCLSLASVSFDANVWELFYPLLSGGCLYLYQDLAGLDIPQLWQYCIEHQLDFAFLAPALLKECDQYAIAQQAVFPLQKIATGAEALQGSLLKSLLKSNPRLQILNAYGPSEATIVATMALYTRQSDATVISDQAVSIGKPLANVQVYLLDPADQLVPIGVVGELCIGGKSLARGYLQQPDLSAEKFVDNPLSSSGKIYRTGDLARWDEAGNLHFIGRKDFQVKIRGYRIEPGEIEQQLRQHADIEDAKVLVNSNSAQNLCAFVISDKAITPQQLQAALGKKLPYYMVPDTFVFLSAFPLNHNNKVDNKTLLALLTEKDIDEPLTAAVDHSEMEQQLLPIWQDVLDLPQVGVHQNFFALGGNSLLAIRLASRLRQIDQQLSLNDLFQAPTIYQLSQHLEARLTSADLLTDADRATLFFAEHYQLRLQWQPMSAEDCHWIVYYEETAMALAQLLVLLKQHCAVDLYPHYCLTFEQQSDHAKVNLQPFDEAQLQVLQTQLIAQRKVFEAQLLDQAIAEQHPLSAIQKFHLSLKRNVSGIILRFDDLIPIPRFEQAFAAVLAQQGLLHSSLNEQQQTLQQHVLPESLSLPYLNLSPYHLDEDHFRTVLHRLFNVDLRQLRLPYQVFLVQRNQREHYLLLLLNHSIFDRASADVLRRGLLQNLSPNQTSSPNQAEVLPYAHYTELLKRGPHISPQQLIEDFQLEQYSRAKAEWETRLIALQQSASAETAKPMQCHFKLPLSGELSEDKIWPLSWLVCNRFVQGYFAADSTDAAIPMKIIYHARQYGQANYANTIGEFLDFMPMLVDLDQPFDQIVQSTMDRVNSVAKSHVNFITLLKQQLNEQDNSRWQAARDLIAPQQLDDNNMMLTFNFLDKMNQKEIDSLYHQSEDSQQPEDIGISSFNFDAYYTDSHLVFMLSFNFAAEPQAVEQLLQHCVEQTLKTLN